MRTTALVVLYFKRCAVFFLLEELQALVVQVEAGVSREVQLLKLLRKRLRQSHLRQLVAAQVHTLRRKHRASVTGEIVYPV